MLSRKNILISFCFPALHNYALSLPLRCAKKLLGKIPRAFRLSVYTAAALRFRGVEPKRPFTVASALNSKLRNNLEIHNGICSSVAVSRSERAVTSELRIFLLRFSRWHQKSFGHSSMNLRDSPPRSSSRCGILPANLHDLRACVLFISQLSPIRGTPLLCFVEQARFPLI